MNSLPVNTNRLRELAHAVTLGPEGRHEFSMRVPAEPERDADLVLSSAADEIDSQRARIAELEAGVYRLMNGSDSLIHGMVCIGAGRLAQLQHTETEVELLRNALYHISLASQNSMSSKEECGRIARTAIQATDSPARS